MNIDGEVAEHLRHDLYVDDLVSGCNTAEEGRGLYDKREAILSEAGLDLAKDGQDGHLREYVASKENVISDLSREGNDMTYFEAISPYINVKHKTVVGIDWDMTTDDFILNFDF